MDALSVLWKSGFVRYAVLSGCPKRVAKARRRDNVGMLQRISM